MKTYNDLYLSTRNLLRQSGIEAYALEARELVKVKIQEGCELSPKDTANLLADELGAEFVQAIGRKFTLYRESKENKQIELPKAKK